MDKKKKIMIVLILAIGGIGILWYMKKKKGATGGTTGATTGGTTGATTGGTPSARQGQVCNSVMEALGGGKGKYLALTDKKGSEGRKINTQRYKVGMSVSVDGGTPTKITKVWKDTNKQIGAVKLADGTANGSKMCIV